MFFFSPIKSLKNSYIYIIEAAMLFHHVSTVAHKVDLISGE